MLMYPLVGSVIMWPKEILVAEDVPIGYLVADGSPVSRGTYAALFAVLGTRYGVGDGSTTFNLPDLRGYFTRFRDGGAGVDPNAGTRTVRPGGGAATDVGTKQASEIKSHQHPVYNYAVNIFAAGPFQSQGLNVPFNVNTNSQGGAESRPYNVTVAGLIKY